MHRISLLARLDRQGVGLMTGELRDALDRGQPIALDAADVDRVGLAGLQMLLSAIRSRGSGEPEIRIVSPSPALIEAAMMAGVAEQLGLAEAGIA